MGASDPDVFVALDFDDLNLDYFLMTSELPAYNFRPGYSYPNTNNLDNVYHTYAVNTLGYVEYLVQHSSNNQFDTIRPVCKDGRPQYEFVERDSYDKVLPQSVLYQPIVLDQYRFSQLRPQLGHLIVNVQCRPHDYNNSIGINPYVMNAVEADVYKAKIPLFQHEFDYPVQNVYIDIVKSNPEYENGILSNLNLKYLAQDIYVNESYYAFEQGQLYFTAPIETLITQKYPHYRTALKDIWRIEGMNSKVYYRLHVYFDVFVPDLTEETHRLALAQASSYAIMDYFNQYTYAEVTANMISEIAYTETVTFWSTIISAPMMMFGSYLVEGLEEGIARAGVQMALTTLTAPIKEVFQEIIMDGFIEAFAENFADIMGWSDDVGYWLSALATSGRETLLGPLGKLTWGKIREMTKLDLEIKNTVKLMQQATQSQDTDTANKLRQTLEDLYRQQSEARQQKEQEKKTWKKLLASDFFKGVLMTIPSAFIGGFNIFSFMGMQNMLSGTLSHINIKTFSKIRAVQQASRRGKLQHILDEYGIEGDVLSRNIESNLKQPTDIDGEALHNLFKEQNEEDLPGVKNTIVFNPNPKAAKTVEKINIPNKFEEIRLANWVDELTKDYKFEDKKKISDQVSKTTNNVEETELKSDIMIGDLYEGLFYQFNKIRIGNLYHEFYATGTLQTDGKKVSKLLYSKQLITDAIIMLSSTKYKGVPIIIDQEINFIVLEAIIAKIKEGHTITQLERIIMDIGIFIEGRYDIIGKVNSASDFNEKFFEKTKRNVKKLGILKVIGRSMFGKLKPGAKVAYEIKNEGEVYNVDDIIVFYRDGVKIVHRVEYIFESNGEIFYVTEGVNSDTNPYVDSDLVSNDQVIGRVTEMSEQDLSALIEMAEQGKVPSIEGLGMSNALEKVYQSLYKTSKSLRNMRDNPIGLTREQLLDFVINKISEINVEAFTDIDKVKEARIRILTTCYEMIERNIYSWFSKDLSKKMITYLYKEFIYPSGKSTHPVSSDYFIDQVLILGEVLKSLNNYYEPETFKENLKALLNSREFRSYNNLGGSQKQEFINNLIKNVWKNSYESLCLELLYKEFTYQGKEALYYKPEDVLIEKTTCTTVLKSPGDNFFQPTEIYLTFGEHEFKFDKRAGNGIIHIFAGHWADFARLHPDLNTPEAIAKFIFELIKSQKGVVMEDGGKIVYAFRFKGEQKVRYVELLVDDGGPMGPEGRLHTAYPVDLTKSKYKDKYIEYRNYFIRHSNLIQNDIDLKNILV
ncbi:MAG: hypothetical protein WBH31_09110 [Promethearchaeia archaeon]